MSRPALRAYLDERQGAHDPQTFLVMGELRPSPEQPGRVAMLKTGAQAAGLAFEAPGDRGIGAIAAVHGADYLAFLKSIHARWKAQPGASAEVIPNIHPRRRADSYPNSPVGQAGWHQADTACPIGQDTWSSAYWSAQSALAAANEVAEGRSAYALCRPPGHHAFSDQAGGFCFLNNAAIAAQFLAARGRRVAILDVDVHHGNGTQGIFYSRGDVLTLSIHADPAGFYPFFWGHAQERGEGAGRGANLNLPLAMGTGDAGYWPALDLALKRIKSFGCDVLVVALGLDASQSDPFQALCITHDGFHQIGRRLAALGVPTALVQEGGYLGPDLATNLTAVLTGFGA